MKRIDIHLCLGNSVYETCTLNSEMVSVSSHLLISRTGLDEESKKHVNDFRAYLIDQLIWVLPDCGFENATELLKHTLSTNTITADEEPWKDAINKILVIVGDFENENPNTDQLNPINLDGFKVLPVFESKLDGKGKRLNVKLASQYSRYNVEWWEKNIMEAVPRLLGMLKMSPDEFKIFISYKRDDTEGVARQLYDELQHRGAEVFLDSFTLSSGINFQKRLAQQLSDKAMVVILESPNLTSSAWVERELSLAKVYRLGCCALYIGDPDKHKLRQIDSENRHYLLDDDYVKSSVPMKEFVLKRQSLDEVVQFIKIKHAVALINKHRYLKQSLEKLLPPECKLVPDESGYLNIITASGQHKVGLNVRPSEARDYYYLHKTDDLAGSLRKAIIGPLLHLQERKRINYWLSERTDIKFYDEGQLLKFINEL